MRRKILWPNKKKFSLDKLFNVELSLSLYSILFYWYIGCGMREFKWAYFDYFYSHIRLIYSILQTWYFFMLDSWASSGYHSFSFRGAYLPYPIWWLWWFRQQIPKAILISFFDLHWISSLKFTSFSQIFKWIRNAVHAVSRLKKQ